MATYYFAVAFNVDATSDPQTDGTHFDAQYGFGVDNGNGVSALGSSGGSGRQFEAVTLPAATSGRPNQFVVTLMSNIIGINQSASYVRCAFRPAHDVAPSNNLPTSPLNNGDSQKLLGGVLLSGNVASNNNISNGTSYGLPAASYSTQWLFSPFNLNPGQSGQEVHFEFTLEITVVDGSGNATYYKVDPEMVIDY